MTILLLLILLIAAGPARLLSQNAPDSVQRSITRMLDSAARARQFSGVIVLAHNGAIAWHGEYGFADREHRVPNVPSTRFNISSVGKLFTQTAIAQLMAEGKIDPRAAVGKYRPDYPNKDVANHVTIAMLLTHRSGVQSDVLQPSRLATLNSNRDYFAEMAKDAPVFTPGTEQRYSNAGFVLLGAIIEALSGEDYYRYVSTHIFAPAGMAVTAFDPLDSVRAGTAVGSTRYLDPVGEHRRAAEEANTRGAVQPHRGSAAGGEFFSAEDLLRFLAARREGRIPDVNARGPARMLGGSAGANAVVFEDFRPGYDLIILANIDPPAARDLLDLVQPTH